MRNEKRTLSGAIFTGVMLAAMSAGFAAAQSQPPTPARGPVVSTSIPSQKEVAATQEELIKLLRLSPTMTEVISRDPSLLSDQEYVSRNNPELAQFLQVHPEVARNPSFYLFTGLNGEGSPENRLERKVWPENSGDHRERPMLEIVMNEVGPFLVLIVILSALLWLIHVLLENRRWGSIFKLQQEAHGKLIDRFSTNQELLVYMETEAGKRFLEAAPIPVNFERDQKMPNAVARVLTPLQIGLVLSLLGVGLMMLRHSIPEAAAALLVFSVITLMPGLGFILSAGVTWALAGRLGLMPDKAGEQNQSNTLFSSKERQ
jgi:hypothetical protein